MTEPLVRAALLP